MNKFLAILVMMTVLCAHGAAQTVPHNFKLVLPDHRGQLRWIADGYKSVEFSAKPNGREIGIRGKDQSGRVTFLGFLFLVPEQVPLTGAKCRDGALEPEKKANPTFVILGSKDDVSSNAQTVSVISYTTRDRSGKTMYMVRGFVAAGEMCGDLEFYSNTSINYADPDLKKIFDSYQLDENYVPRFTDVLLYAQILYHNRSYKSAAPLFESALEKLRDDQQPDARVMRRVVTDQAGMSYGMSGDIPKARTIFEKAIAADPDYPMYYYNLACADAEEKNLTAARSRLQEAFARKSNTVPGEIVPDPTKDDSFLPYRSNRDFWTFLEGLTSKK